MTDEIEKALSYDSIHEAEKLTGKDYKEDESVVWLGMALMQKQAETKDALLFLSCDTNAFRQTLAEWIAIIEGMGFALVHCESIEGTEDKLRVFWRPGVLLVTDSYSRDTSVNSAKAYFNFRGPRDAMFHCGSGFAGEVGGVEVWSGGIDAREGLRFTLDKMTESGELLPLWIERPFLWLLSYMDTKKEGYDYNAINSVRIAKLPEDVRLAISPAGRAAAEGSVDETGESKSGAGSASAKSSDLRTVDVPKAEQREPQVRCDAWLGVATDKSGAPTAERSGRSGVGGDSNPPN